MSNRDIVKRNLDFQESTSKSLKSRKRKLSNEDVRRSSMRELMDSSEDDDSSKNEVYHSPKSDSSSYKSIFSETFEDLYSCTSNFSLNSNDLSQHFDLDSTGLVVSSPKDATRLSSSFERCSLFDLDLSVSAKRAKWDLDTPRLPRRKSSSAPGTPQRNTTETDSPIKKYRSLDLTPTKSSVLIKSSTPETKKILYPNLIERKPAVKPKTPQKLRQELKRLTKPAKKRLFICRDFVYLFTKSSNNIEIVKKIFGYLTDSDLGNVGKVSKLWRNVLKEDWTSYKRYKSHTMSLVCSKENLWQRYSSDIQKPVSSKIGLGQPVVGHSSEKENRILASRVKYSPAKSNWDKYTKLAANLDNDQHLTKCPMCSDPSVLEKTIAQCSKFHCQYIWCVRCLSGSKRGPDHFVCKCEKSMTPPRAHSSLYDISNKSRSCSFFTPPRPGSSMSTGGSSLLNTFNTSSGYYSQSDLERSNAEKSTAISVLTNSNRVGASKAPVVLERGSASTFRSVAEQCMRKKEHKGKKDEPYEPSSPPKVKIAPVGSEKSKKSLRRLL